MTLHELKSRHSALLAARYSGTRSVSYDGKTVNYGSDAELAYDHLLNQSRRPSPQAYEQEAMSTSCLDARLSPGLGSIMATYQTPLPQVFGALSDATRLAVVERLVQGPASVSQLSRPFEMARPTFLKHLQVLETAGIVTSEKTGRVRTVSLSPDALTWVEAWVRQHRQRWERRLNDLATHLDTENPR